MRIKLILHCCDDLQFINRFAFPFANRPTAQRGIGTALLRIYKIQIEFFVSQNKKPGHGHVSVRHAPVCSFFLQFAASCAMLSLVLPAPWQAVPPPSTFSIGGETTSFYPQSIKRGVVRRAANQKSIDCRWQSHLCLMADMIVTWSDLIQFGILIFAILAYAENKKK